MKMGIPVIIFALCLSLTACIPGGVDIPQPGSLPAAPPSAPPQPETAPQETPEEPPVPLEATLIVQADTKPAAAIWDTQLIAQKLLAHINEARGKEGLDELIVNDSLVWAARTRSRELLVSFSHMRPNGKAYHTIFDEAGFDYADKWHGENTCILHTKPGSSTEDEIAGMLFDDLSASVGNSKNMTRSQYELVGIGVSMDLRDGIAIIVSSQIFAGE
ncbi:MAG: CAP domain-containing protein [Oscillospiraceae bacterium]|nr:CAP domain-containing protein [Oscillospiraceae bacterium]